MSGITVTVRIIATVALIVAPIWVSVAAPAHTAPPPTPPLTQVRATFAAPGPHVVRATVRTVSCTESVFGALVSAVARLDGEHSRLTCSGAFPYGLASPVGVHFYYPLDLAEHAPTVVFVPGITADPGMYAALARHWASHGFIVAVAYDFYNSMPESPTLGVGALRLANDDRRNPLYRKVDFSRITFAGHSAGGQSALLAASIFPTVGRLIDPRFRVTAVLPIAEGPLALGSTITAPALVLAGTKDWVVPAWAWPQWWHFDLMRSAPAYFAVAHGAGHLSVVSALATNPFVAISTAWLRYTSFDDALAATYFAGPNWLAGRDRTFTLVRRNAVARAATAPSGH